MTNVDIVKKYIINNEQLFCDDCISEILNIKPRQQINQICRYLQSIREINREKQQCSNCSKDKIVNKTIKY